VGIAGQPTHYDVLQVSPTAEQELIEAAYRRLAQRYHPDVSSDPDAADRMKQINIAYQVLRDPRRRIDYDLSLDPSRRRRLIAVARPAEPPSRAEPATLSTPPTILTVGVVILALVVVAAVLWPAEAAPWREGATLTRSSDSVRLGLLAVSPTPRVTATPPAVVVAAPIDTPTVRPATPTVPTAREAWPEVERDLVAVWGLDWPRAVALIDEFRVKYPDHQPSGERLHSALLRFGESLVTQGRATEAVGVLQRAEALRPNQGEATALLLALTPAPTATPGLDARWLALLRQIDPFWGRDWPRVIGPVQEFLVQQPDYAPAVDKLYAALVFYGQELLARNLEIEAVATLERARELLPERTEAVVALQALLPEPEPAPPPPAQRVQQPAVRQPTAVVRQPAPAARPPPAAAAPPPPPAAAPPPPPPAPTPTKVPFPGRAR
jgi:hypothetical protein